MEALFHICVSIHLFSKIRLIYYKNRKLLYFRTRKTDFLKKVKSKSSQLSYRLSKKFSEQKSSNPIKVPKIPN